MASAIDASNLDFFRDVNLSFPLWEYGGNFYAGLLRIGTRFDLYKSTDLGGTWTRLDGAGAPANGNAYFDGDHTVYACCAETGATPHDTIAIASMDLDTEAWGGVAGGGPECQSVNAIWKRPDGSFLVLYDAGNPIISGKEGSSRLWSVVWDGGSWVSDQDAGVSSGLTGTTGATSVFAYIAASAMDSDGRVHVFYGNFNYDSIWYQAIEPDNSLGAAINFGDALATANHAPPFGRPAILDDAIFFPVGLVVGAAKRPAVYIGTGLASPTWALSPVLDSTLSVVQTPAAIALNDSVAIVVPVSDAALSALISSDGGATWDGAPVYDAGTEAPPDYYSDFGLQTIVIGPGTNRVLMGSNFHNLSVQTLGAFLGWFDLDVLLRNDFT